MGQLAGGARGGGHTAGCTSPAPSRFIRNPGNQQEPLGMAMWECELKSPTDRYLFPSPNSEELCRIHIMHPNLFLKCIFHTLHANLFQK